MQCVSLFIQSTIPAYNQCPHNPGFCRVLAFERTFYKRDIFDI